MSDLGDELKRQVDQALESGNTILRACGYFLEVVSPTVDAICDQINFELWDSDLVYRCIIRRTQENLQAIIGITESEYSYMSIMPLRPLCEDLIYGAWLRTLPSEDVDQLIELSVLDDVFKSMDAQKEFLPKAYEQYGQWPDGRRPSIAIPFFSQTQSAAAGADQTQLEHKLKLLGLKLGWRQGKRPSIYQMAKQSGLEEIYSFFYHGSSKAVHANLHNMLRMVWGTPGGKFSITSHNFENYYKQFSLVYGVWLASEVFERIIRTEFPEEAALVDAKAYSVWLALVVVGMARNGVLPLLVTAEELRWTIPEVNEQGAGDG